MTRRGPTEGELVARAWTFGMIGRRKKRCRLCTARRSSSGDLRFRQRCSCSKAGTGLKIGECIVSAVARAGGRIRITLSQDFCKRPFSSDFSYVQHDKSSLA
jgi:hypothetical protein